MRLVSFLAAASAVVALLLTTACSSDSDGRSGGSSGLSGSPTLGGGDSGGASVGEPVHGEVRVAWRNLDPSKPKAAIALINESSELGARLKSGKANSSEIRVLSDSEMGGLLAELGKLGFFQYATDGIGLDNAPDVSGRRGIVVVTQDGRDKGLMLTTNLGRSPIPKAYVDSKNLLFAIHSQVPGADIKVGIGAPDDSIFSVPPAKLRRP